ncbi:MAG: hypothetical protein EXR75_16085 [Myxococcales bacterium]|nr:hypothetical protein [Myxococcales bacterium]
MILVDSSPLVALCDPRDRLHKKAMVDLDRLARRSLVLCAPVLTEACFLLEHAVQRMRLERIVTELAIRPFLPTDELALWLETFRWLERYAEHAPDWCDGYLTAVSSLERKAKVWTYDGAFRTTWRRLDGTRIPLATR